jgi:hypothetical protein
MHHDLHYKQKLMILEQILWQLRLQTQHFQVQLGSKVSTFLIKILIEYVFTLFTYLF